MTVNPPLQRKTRVASPFILAAALVVLTAPSVALAGETQLARAVSCQVGDGEIAKLMDRLATEDAGMKAPAQSLAAPSGNLYRLARPFSALGYSTSEIYVSPSRIAMVVSGQPLASVSARLHLAPTPYGPAERPVDDTRKIIAYELHQDALAGKVLVGCEYADSGAQGWLAQDAMAF
jgi:hypothetical protein